MATYSMLHRHVDPRPGHRILGLVLALFLADPSTVWSARQSHPEEQAKDVSLDLRGPTSPLQIGTVRFEALVEHGPQTTVSEVRFQLDGTVVVQRRASPYTASIYVGRIPEQHIVTAIAVDEQGVELARDELVLNRQRNTFALRFVEPVTQAPTSSRSRSAPNANAVVGSSAVDTDVKVELDLNLPPGAELAYLDLFLGETKIHVFDHGPFATRVMVANRDQTSYLRAVAHLGDGNTREAIVFLNGADLTENMDIQYVQLYLSAHHRRSKRPVLDLTAGELEISEDGFPQEIRRFEKVSDLALNLAVLLDVSASMAPRLAISTQAAQGFFEQTMRPSDRATLITFNDRPTLAVNLTADTKKLALGLQGTRAQRGTALYDSLVFALYQLSGVTGQRATLLLSDGSDETSTLRYEDALEYAKRAGIPIYAIRIEQGKKARRARAELQELTTETGGLAFFIHDASELAAVYKTISEELRSRFLATYQSNQQTTNPRFREIQLGVNRKGITVTTRRGYYP